MPPAPDRLARQEMLAAEPARAATERAQERAFLRPAQPTPAVLRLAEPRRAWPARADAAELVRVALEREGSLRVAL
jgi:DNA-binding TFAR19-related protein (PDSD5 family)